MVSVTHTPVNDLDYSAAEYGHVDGVPSPYTFSIPDGPLTDEQAIGVRRCTVRYSRGEPAGGCGYYGHGRAGAARGLAPRGRYPSR